MDETKPLVDDGTIAQDESQSLLLWKLRESVSESLQRDGVVYKYDISLPLSHFYQIVEDMR
jgi:D-2-hydroxyglutarate dehydrogenase